MKQSTRSVLSLVHTCVAIVVCVTVSLTTRVHAQLFDGLPDPTIENYAITWDAITGLEYRPGASSLMLGTELGSGYYELVAFQHETESGNAIAMVVGTAYILEEYNYNWLLPYTKEYAYDDGTNDFTFRIDTSSTAAAVLIDADNGLSVTAVADIASIQMEITGGTGPDVEVNEQAGMFSLIPFGFVADPMEAGEIAARIAALSAYTGPPIDPNPGSGDPGGGGNPPTQISLSCEDKCMNTYNTGIAICNNNLDGALHNCGLSLGGWAAEGCAGGALLCTVVPIPGVSQLACCVLGGAGNMITQVFLCKARAENEFDTCAANAWEEYRLCMLNECGIVIAEP